MQSSAFHFEERSSRDEHHNGNQGLTPREGSYGNGAPSYAGVNAQHYGGGASSSGGGGGSQFGGPQYGGGTGGRYEMLYSNKSAAKLPPQSPHSGRGNSYGSQYPHQYSTHPMTSRHLQSVVTSSFSLEDERDDPSRSMGRRFMHSRMAVIERRNDYSEREDNTSGDREGVSYFPHSNYEPHPAPVHRTASNSSDFINRSFSSGSASFKSASEPLKRSYYHHSRPSEVQTAGGQLPPDFMPPKRIKIKEPTRGEVLVTPRSPDGSDNVRPGEWLSRGQTWESIDDETYRVTRNQSFPPHQTWAKPQPAPLSPLLFRNDEQKLHAHVTPAMDTEPSPRNWHPRNSSEWTGPSRPHVPQYRYWDSPEEHGHHGRWNTSEPAHQSLHNVRPEAMGRMHPDMPNRNPEPVLYQRGPAYAYNDGRAADRMQMVVEAAAAAKGEHREQVDNKGDNLLLLALPQDRVALSETLCVVRENIEVFTATQSDVDAPAPGRKHAVVVGQVGLRCIHCRHTTKCSDRVKRAVCYPSSIKRIYRTVIDMKLDHFSQCRFVPDGLKGRLQQLKAVQTRSTGTTMQYFIRAAHSLGMEDGPSGVRFRETKKPMAASEQTRPHSTPEAKPEAFSPMGTVVIHRTGSESTNVTMESAVSKRSDSMMSTESFDSNGSPDTIVSLDKYYDGRVPLALPEDKASLSPLRCFLREQVSAFSATDEDIAVRAPTTFSITVGQVGIGCIHCLKQPPKLRSNRAVCFPFSIGRIYQSVADIQRFHFTECKMLPADIKEKFLELQSASSKGSKGLATRQYWVTSAKKIGLVDTQKGIRFGRDPTQPEESKAFSLDILAQAAFTVTTANKQLVVEEDRETIAEFLYVVMEQLQPCRFTEADRNKRRLKDVGCIGVECKHCAGQVDGRKFFWSSVSAVESNFVSVHTHMLECKMVPEALKEKLADLKKLRKQQTAALKTGSQKAFFSRVWKRLHDEHSEAHGNDGAPVDEDPECATNHGEARRSEQVEATFVVAKPENQGNTAPEKEEVNTAMLDNESSIETAEKDDTKMVSV